MALDQPTRARVRMHLGYPNVAPAGSITLGIPSASQPMFILESGMNSIMAGAEDLVLREVAELDCILQQVSEARGRRRARSIAELHLRADELERLLDHYTFWREKLAMELGAMVNPFAVDVNGPVRLRLTECC